MKTKPSFQNHFIWSHSKKKVFGFRKQRLSEDSVFKTCIDFNPFQKSELSWISKVLQIAPSFFKQDFKTTCLEKFWYLQNVFNKMVWNFTYSLIQNIFCPKSPFGKAYKMVWILRLPLQKAQMFLKIVSKEVRKTKTFYKSFDFINWKPI